VKNALASIVEDILGDTLAEREDEERLQISALQTYLGVTDRPIDELNNEQDNQTVGSCSWIEDRDSFQSWLEVSNPSARMYWIHAQPATGKTVLSGHVITQLQESGRDCSYYFFKHGQKGKNTLSALLRSLAFQMALMHPAVRKELASMQEFNVTFDKDDERAIWRKLFTGTILKVALERPQYWIIDALDECVDPSKLFPLLSRIESKFPVQLFITSRPWPEFERQFARLGRQVVIDTIPVEDTTHDIRLFFEENVDTLPVENEVDRLHLVEKLVKKSTGCFLWARLVLQELQAVYSEEYITDVIDELPMEMGPLYERILHEMSKNVREKRLAKALLIWAICAVRPLQSSELVNSIKIDEEINVPSLERSIQGLCGQLLHVDKTGSVQVMHMTTRTFLTDGSLDSEFAINKAEGNQRLAITCLKYLSGEEMRPPRNRTVLNIPRGTKSAIADYACVAFSEHLAMASSSNNDLFLALEKFLRSNVLTWIEYIAKTKKNLYYLTRTAKNLQKYLGRRARHTPPLGDAYRYVNQWATDLVRLVAKFGRNLLEYPDSIYYLITPFCPRASSIYEMFTDPHSGLMVAGHSNDTWEDSICYIDFRNNRAMSVGAGDNTFAIGTKSGRVVLYWQKTCQERMSLEHGEAARVLSFDNSHRLACSGARKISLWDLDSHDLLWAHHMKDSPVLLQFAPDDSFIIAATRRSHAIALSCEDGSVMREQSFPSQQAPISVAISPDCRMIAFAYRGKAVLLWSLDNDRLLGACGGKAGSTDMISNSSPQEVIFNANPAVELMVVTFQNGNMILYETWNQRAVKSAQQDCHYMACSPDGRTLATGSSWGALGLWDFETLTLLYQINTRETLGKALSFTGCGTRIIELRDRKTKVWEPAVLIRKASEEDSSISESVTMPALMIGEGQEDIVAITSGCVHPRKDVIFIGKDDGTMNAYSASTGELQTQLYSHNQDIFVRKIAASADDVVASEDASNTVIARTYAINNETQSSSTLLLNHRFDDTVQQFILNAPGTKLLVSTNTHDYLFHRTPGTPFELHTIESLSRTIWRWTTSPSDPDSLFLLNDNTLKHISWTDLSETHPPRTLTMPFTASDSTRSSIKTPNSTDLELSLKALSTNPTGTHLIAEFAHTHGSKPTAHLAVWHLTNNSPDAVEPIFSLSARKIKHLLGVYEDNIVFLNHELWVCSIDLSTLADEAHTPSGNMSSPASSSGKGTNIKKHFFIPLEYVGGNEGSMGCVSGVNGGVIFPKEGEVVVVREG
jgi:WD40 repeat protein